MKHIPTMQRLTRQLQNIPYLASKNLYRVAAYFLTSDKKQLEQLCQAILDAKAKIRRCNVCFNWTETQEVCEICVSDKRDKGCICVVESWHDLLAIEKSEEFRGVYHVLGGALCPLEGVGPDDLMINEFLQRIDHSVKEVIFATNPTPEGEATASLIASKMVDFSHVKISRLASGVPMGSSLEYMDRVTIHRALSGRRSF